MVNIAVSLDTIFRIFETPIPYLMFPTFIKQSNDLAHFRLRGTGGSRLEALSDGVFALAIAMLLLSTSVPSNFDELWLFITDLLPFSICSIFIFWIWREHSAFFRRYGLTEDEYVRRMIFILIMLVPFYVYALKFLTSWLVHFLGGSLVTLFTGKGMEFTVGPLMQLVSVTQLPQLMAIYAIGFMAVFGLFALLYRYVLKHADLLELNARERIETRFSFLLYRSMVLAGLLSLFFALIGLLINWPWMSFFSGAAYNLLWIIGGRQRKWRERALKEEIS